MVFSQKPTIMRPVICMGEQQIPEVTTTEFLGLYWDQRLTLIPHVAQLKNNCFKSLILLRTLSCKECGADQQILMGTYRLRTYRTLGVVMNEAMLISSGAFKTSPVTSLKVLTTEPPLAIRRKYLTLRYYFKSKCHFQNPAYGCVIDAQLEMFFKSRLSATPSFVIRAKEAMEHYKIPNQPVLPFITSQYYTWKMIPTSINIDMAEDSVDWTAEGGAMQFFTLVAESLYPTHIRICTDESKSITGVGSAAVMGDKVRKATLPKQSMQLNWHAD